MDAWHPRCIDEPANKLGGTFTGVPFKVVLHTTESTSSYDYDPGSYYGNPYWPHATIDENGIHQHLPITVAAYALYHGTVQTNNANAVQCEIVWRAGDIDNIPDSTLGHVADWVRWVCEQTGAPPQVCPQGFHGPGEGMVLASADSPIRFSDGDWLSFSGICGHQHVPSGNDHWDPGAFPIERCLGIAGQEDDLKQDEHDALIFCAQFLEDLKQGRWVPTWATDIENRLVALEGKGNANVTVGSFQVTGVLDLKDRE